MKKTAIIILLALGSLAAYAGNEPVLDCDNLGDGVEASVCEAAQATTCEKAAATAVQLIQQIRSGQDVLISKVKTLQEDERYEVGYQYIEGDIIPDVLYVNEVFVSAGPGGCSVSSIR